ncbi:hypothetical protein Tco_0869198 [Tanacetum coccineum]
MPPKKTTTPMSDAAIKALVARSVADALVEHEANRSRNRDDSHDSGSGRRRMESVFHISNYTIENQVKFATCNLIGVSVTWWNSHVKTIGHDAAYGMPWKMLMKMKTDKYGPRKSDWVEKYVGGLPDMIQGSVMASKPKTMQEAIEIANDLMYQKVRTFTKRQAENKRKLDNNSSDKNIQQQPPKKQNVARAYSAGSSERKEYAGTLPL